MRSSLAEVCFFLRVTGAAEAREAEIERLREQECRVVK